MGVGRQGWGGEAGVGWGGRGGVGRQGWGGEAGVGRQGGEAGVGWGIDAAIISHILSLPVWILEL